MANFETMMQATLRVDEAERSVRVAAIRLSSLVPGATPLQRRGDPTTSNSAR
jgi:hypothetical protein